MHGDKKILIWLTTCFCIFFSKPLGMVSKTITDLWFLAKPLSFFLKIGVISANLIYSGNWQFCNISYYHICWSKGLQISDFSLISLARMIWWNSFSIIDVLVTFFNISQIHFSKSKRAFNIKLFSNGNNAWMTTIFTNSKFYWIRISNSFCVAFPDT